LIRRAANAGVVTDRLSPRARRHEAERVKSIVFGAARAPIILYLSGHDGAAEQVVIVTTSAKNSRSSWTRSRRDTLSSSVTANSRRPGGGTVKCKSRTFELRRKRNPCLSDVTRGSRSSTPPCSSKRRTARPGSAPELAEEGQQLNPRYWRRRPPWSTTPACCTRPRSATSSCIWHFKTSSGPWSARIHGWTAAVLRTDPTASRGAGRTRQLMDARRERPRSDYEHRIEGLTSRSRRPSRPGCALEAGAFSL
jgi:hypothetical protein